MTTRVLHKLFFNSYSNNIYTQLGIASYWFVQALVKPRYGLLENYTTEKTFLKVFYILNSSPQPPPQLRRRDLMPTLQGIYGPTVIMLSGEWLSRYGLLENYIASVTHTGTRTTEPYALCAVELKMYYEFID